MEIASIDNSSRSVIEKAITWQFDKASKLVATIKLMSDYAEQSTKDFWDLFANIINLFGSSETPDDFSLSVWGNILGIPRPTYGDDGIAISGGLYKKILLAEYNLRNSAYSLKDINDYIEAIGLNDIGFSVSVDGNMAISYSQITPEEGETDELVLLASTGYFERFPAAVKSNEKIRQTVFGFSGQAENTGKYVIVWVWGTPDTAIPSLVSDGSTILPVEEYSMTAIGKDGIGYAMYRVSIDYSTGDISTSDLSSSSGINFATNISASLQDPNIGFFTTGSEGYFASYYIL